MNKVYKGGEVLDTIVLSWAGLVELSPQGWLEIIALSVFGLPPPASLPLCTKKEDIFLYWGWLRGCALL